MLIVIKHKIGLNASGDRLVWRWSGAIGMVSWLDGVGVSVSVGLIAHLLLHVVSCMYVGTQTTKSNISSLTRVLIVLLLE